MSRYLNGALNLCALAMLAACGSQSTREPSPIEPFSLTDNPMPKIWAGVVDEIRSLEKTKSVKSKWSAAAESEELVKTREQLEGILNRSRLSEQERALARQMFKSGQLIAHFGFEADYHALVFFDATQKPTRVFAW